MYFKDIAGQRFGRLVAIERRPNRGPNVMWLFACDCGNVVETYSGSVKRGSTKSCGCLQQEVRSSSHMKHGACSGHSKPTSEWRAWRSARNRCFNPRDASYANYGGRGIGMDALWVKDFSAFFEHVGPKPAGTSLERIDNDRGYEPGNCRWATAVEQGRNRRTTVFVGHDGRVITLKEFAKVMGVGYVRLSARMKKKGETAHEAAAAMIARRQRMATLHRATSRCHATAGAA